MYTKSPFNVNDYYCHENYYLYLHSATVFLQMTVSCFLLLHSVHISDYQMSLPRLFINDPASKNIASADLNGV